MKSVEYINGHMKGKVFIAAHDDEVTHAVYYHTWCGKLESITYTIVEDIAITNTLEYPDTFCTNCQNIGLLDKKRVQGISSDPY